MRKIMVLIFCCGSCILMKAQDTIHRIDSSLVMAKVLEVDISKIKYQRTDNPNGPIYTIRKSEVSKIVYENGTADYFTYQKPDTFIYKPNIVSFYIMDLIINRVTFSYERCFRNGYTTVTIPVSFGYFNNTHNTFVTGIDVNFYPHGQGALKYFYGLKMRVGSYGNIGLFDFEGVDYFVSCLANNGIIIHPSTNIRILCSLGLGAMNFRVNEWHVDQHYKYDQVFPCASFDFNIGYCF